MFAGAVQGIHIGCRHMACRNFAQCNNSILVLAARYEFIRAAGQLTSACCRQQYQLKAVLDMFQTIFNRNSGHRYPIKYEFKISLII